MRPGPHQNALPAVIFRSPSPLYSSEACSISETAAPPQRRPCPVPSALVRPSSPTCAGRHSVHVPNMDYHPTASTEFTSACTAAEFDEPLSVEPECVTAYSCNMPVDNPHCSCELTRVRVGRSESHRTAGLRETDPVRDLTTWTVLRNDGPDHLGLRRNAFPSAPNGLDHLGIVCPSGGHSPPEARRRHTCWPAVDGRRRVSLQLQEGFSVGIAAVSRGSPAAPAPLAR